MSDYYAQIAAYQAKFAEELEKKPKWKAEVEGFVNNVVGIVENENQQEVI